LTTLCVQRNKVFTTAPLKCLQNAFLLSYFFSKGRIKLTRIEYTEDINLSAIVIKHKTTLKILLGAFKTRKIIQVTLRFCEANFLQQNDLTAFPIEMTEKASERANFTRLPSFRLSFNPPLGNYHKIAIKIRHQFRRRRAIIHSPCQLAQGCAAALRYIIDGVFHRRRNFSTPAWAVKTSFRANLIAPCVYMCARVRTLFYFRSVPFAHRRSHAAFCVCVKEMKNCVSFGQYSAQHTHGKAPVRNNIKHQFLWPR
jgi:hypothetical protein